MPLADDQIIGLIKAIPGFTSILCGLAVSSYRRAIHWALTMFVLYVMVGSIAAGHNARPLDAIPEILGMATGVVLIAALSQAVRRGVLAAASASVVWETRQTPSDRTRDTESDAATDELLASFVHASRRGVQPIVTATFFIAALGAAWWSFTPHSMDRWVRADDAVACTDESDAAVIANSSSPTSRRTSTGFRVAKQSCHLLLANERVRIIRVSNDAAVAQAYLFRGGSRRWVIVSDLSASGASVVWPWFPSLREDLSRLFDQVLVDLGIKVVCKGAYVEWLTECVVLPGRLPSVRQPGNTMTDTPSDDQVLRNEPSSLFDESAATPAFSSDPTRPPPNLFDLPVQNAIESVEK